MKHFVVEAGDRVPFRPIALEADAEGNCKTMPRTPTTQINRGRILPHVINAHVHIHLFIHGSMTDKKNPQSLLYVASVVFNYYNSGSKLNGTVTKTRFHYLKSFSASE